MRRAAAVLPVLLAISLAGTAASAAPAGGSRLRQGVLARTPDSQGIPPFVFPSGPSKFVTLEPTTTADGYNTKDITAPGTGRLTLREAFALANKLDVEVSIVLQRNAVYRLDRCGPFDAPADTVNELVHTSDAQFTLAGSGATIVQACDGAGVLIQRGGKRLFNLVELKLQGGRSTHMPGGAVWRTGPGEVRVSNTVIIDNRVSGAADGFSAGGVMSDGEVFISGSTLADNHSDHGAGAVASHGAVKAVKASFYGNSGPLAASIVGGRVALPPNPKGPPPFTGVTPDGVTLVYATLDEGAAPVVRVSAGSLTSFGSIIAASGSRDVCALTGAAVHSLGFNAAGTGCGLTDGPGDLHSIGDLGLRWTAGLRRVKVLAPAAGSPLRDAIPKADCMTPRMLPLIPVYSGVDSDELGTPRPQGHGCDIGAIESVDPGGLVRAVGAAPMSDIPGPVSWGPDGAAVDIGAHTIVPATMQDTYRGHALSLRDAVARANESATDTTIVLQPRAVYRLDRCEPPLAAIDNQTDDLVYLGSHRLTIQGNGATIEQVCDGSGVLTVYANAPVDLVGLTLAGGRAMTHPGGGIYLAGSASLTLDRVWLTDNVSVAAGGGIAAYNPIVLIDSAVSHNRSTEVGGGIIGTVNLTLINSSVFDNTASLGLGGVANHSGHMTLIFSTVTHNTAPNVAAGSMSAVGSIISDALKATGPGGGPPGAAPSGPNGMLPLANCAIEIPSAGLGGNLADDKSCGFKTVAPSLRFDADPRLAATHLVPVSGGPAAHRVPIALCNEYRLGLDQMGQPRWNAQGGDAGAVVAGGNQPGSPH